MEGYTVFKEWIVRVVVTGATGFLGQRLCDALLKTPAHVVTWSREVDGSLLSADAAKLREVLEGCDAVVHCAWASTAATDYASDPDNHKWTAATLDLADQVHASGAYLLALGSVFDRQSRESSQVRTVYGDSKVALREGLQERLTEGYRIGLLSPGYIFSPRDARPSVIRDFLRAKGSLSVVREPDAFHDFVHVDDVVAALSHTLWAERVGVLEYGLGLKHTVSQLLRGLDRHDPPCDGLCNPSDHMGTGAGALPPAITSWAFFHGLT